MDVKEKLEELIYSNSPRLVEEEAEILAKGLIAHGVTVSEEVEELKTDNRRLRDMRAKAVPDLSKAEARGVTALPPTNGDRIRAMNDEELAKWIDGMYCKCVWCDVKNPNCVDMECTDCIKIWLKQPPKEEA